jgi:hypothetical protein
MNTDDADDEMSETTGMYISEDVGLVKVVEDHSVSQEEVDQVLDGEDLNAITLRGVRRKLEQLQGLQERALDHCKASITGLVVIHIENLSMRSTTDKKTKKGKKGKKDKKEEAGLLSVDRFGFTRVRYFGILSFAVWLRSPAVKMQFIVLFTNPIAMRDQEILAPHTCIFLEWCHKANISSFSTIMLQTWWERVGWGWGWGCGRGLELGWVI